MKVWGAKGAKEEVIFFKKHTQFQTKITSIDLKNKKFEIIED